MHLIVYGPGRLGSTIATAATTAGWDTSVVGRGHGVGGRPQPAGDVVVDASIGEAVLVNVAEALAAGNRRFVLAATGWQRDDAAVERLVRDAGAASVVAPNLSIGAALFLRLAESAARGFGAVAGFEPSIVEWHRTGKQDRPSGTAREIERRIARADPRWADPDVDAAAGQARDRRSRLEVAAVRAGTAPGTHLVTFDGPGESIELRMTARDRSPYADGALAAARWLVAADRAPGFHSFDAVVDDLLPAPTLARPA